VPEPPTVDIVLKVPSDAASGMSCGVQAIGFVWLETADYRLVGPGYFGNPMVADSSRHSSVSIVPVLVSLPANTTPAGMSTFTDPVNGWRIDYPDEWSLGTDNNVVTVSNGADAGSSSLVSLAVASVPVGEAAIVNRDSHLPLTTGQFSPVGDRSVLNFQENGLPYVATIATGSAASKADVDALSSALGSLRFPALREGDESGPWYAVGPSGAYPSGKGESAYLGPDDLGYVIRAPGGDYALGPNIPSCGEGESYGWDEHSREIVLSCPNGDEARYTINGTPLPGNPTGYTTPLEPYRVVTTWDDVLLTSVHQPLGSDPTGLWP